MDATKREDVDDRSRADDTTTAVGEPRTEQHADVDQYTDLSLTLHLRPADSVAVEHCQQRIRQRFEDICGQWTLESISTDRWYKRVHAPTTDPDEERAVSLFDEFQTTIDDLGGRLTPFFDQRKNESILGVGSTDRIIVFPVACVTVRRDGALVGLYPCWLAGVHHSVGDFLDRLEAGEPVTNLV